LIAASKSATGMPVDDESFSNIADMRMPSGIVTRVPARLDGSSSSLRASEELICFLSR